MHRSRADSTAISACNYIAELALYDPYLKYLLFDCLPTFDATLLVELEQDVKETWTHLNLDPLLASSRKALTSVTEVKIHRMWSEFYAASAPGGLISSDLGEWYLRIGPFLGNVEHLFTEYAVLKFHCGALLIMLSLQRGRAIFLGPSSYASNITKYHSV